jgi:hypothetical protein
MPFVEAIKDSPEKFGEAWLSCLLVMVQGDVAALTLKHAQIAAKTGFITALACLIGGLLVRRRTLFLDILFTGIFTTIADFSIHPTHFGGPWDEAIVTGLGASLLALGFHFVVNRRMAS